MWLSPNISDSQVHSPPTLDEKVRLFEDRVEGWQLGIADAVINGAPYPTPEDKRSPIPHSGYAVLRIILSYFEMVAKFQAGYDDSRQSFDHFQQGVLDVFPELDAIQSNDRTPLLEALYVGGRCGLYHGCMTDARIVLTGEIPSAMAFNRVSHHLLLNPHIMVTKLRAHLQRYVARLKNAANTDVRDRFERRFDFEAQPHT